MSTIKTPEEHADLWIVRHREGWCTLPPGAEPDPEALNDPTLCGYVVNLRGGIDRGMPDCPDCLAVLRNPNSCPGTTEYGHGLTLTTVHAGGCCERWAVLASIDGIPNDGGDW